MSIQRWEDGVDCMEEYADGEWVSYKDAEADKAAALKEAGDTIERQTELLETGASVMEAQTKQVAQLRAQILRMKAAGDDMRCYCSHDISKEDWDAACADLDQEGGG